MHALQPWMSTILDRLPQDVRTAWERAVRVAYGDRG